MDKKIDLCLLLILNCLFLFTSTTNDNTLSTSSPLIYYGDVNSNKIYLTFDDGYPYKNTKIVLMMLHNPFLFARITQASFIDLFLYQGEGFFAISILHSSKISLIIFSSKTKQRIPIFLYDSQTFEK